MTEPVRSLDPATDALIEQAVEVAARIYWRRHGGTLEEARQLLPDAFGEVLVEVCDEDVLGRVGYESTWEERATLYRALEAMA